MTATPRCYPAPSTGVVPTPPAIDTITVDTSPPVTRHADGVNYYATGNEIGLTVNFTKDVSVTGSPQLEFFIGSDAKSADYDSNASTSTALKFKYTVKPGDQGNVNVRSNPVKLSTGDAITGDSAPANPYFLGLQPMDQRVLGIPFITALAFTSDPGGNQTYGLRDALDLTVTYSEDVTVSDGNNLTMELDLDGTPRTAAYASGTGASELVFRYIVSWATWIPMARGYRPTRWAWVELSRGPARARPQPCGVTRFWPNSQRTRWMAACPALRRWKRPLRPPMMPWHRRG